MKIAEDAVKLVVQKLSGSSCPRDMDSDALQRRLLKFRENIKIICTSVYTFVDWKVNKRMSWAAYCEFMYGHLIALDKQTRFFLVRVGETWKRLLSKIFLRVTGPETTSACQDDHLFSGLKAIIYGIIHGVQAIWDTKSTKEYWGFLLVNTESAFNEINGIIMLWTV